MKEKERCEILKLYGDMARMERRLNAIHAREDAKWNNLGGGYGTLLEKTKMGSKQDRDLIQVDDSRRALAKAIQSLKQCLEHLGVSKEDLIPLLPTK